MFGAMRQSWFDANSSSGGPYTASYLIVAGGGGGGYSAGGGAGGVLHGTQTLTPTTVYSFTVGVGGEYFGNVTAGNSSVFGLTAIGGGSGGYTLTTTGIKYAGGSNTLSTAAGSIDMLNVLFDGTNYYGSLVKGYV